MERRKNEGKELLGASTSTSTADMEEKCQICEANLKSLDAVGRAAHINKCLKIDKISTLILGKKNRKIIDLFLKSDEERQIRMREEEEEMEKRRKNEGKELLGASTSSSTADMEEKCQICEANLNSLDAVGRAAHINKCLKIDKISRVILGNKNRKITDHFLKSEKERQTRMREEEEEMERRKNNKGKELLEASTSTSTADMEEKCQTCEANLNSLDAVGRAAHINKCLKIDQLSRSLIVGMNNKKMIDLFLKSEEERLQTRMRHEEKEEMERRKNNKGKKLLGASTSTTADKGFAEMERRKNNKGKKLLGASSTSTAADKGFAEMERRKNNKGKKVLGASSTSTTGDIEKCQICGANLKSLAAALRAAHIDKCLNKLFN